MSILFEERLSDSPYIDTIEHVIATEDGQTICAANGRWYMMVSKYRNQTNVSVVGPLTKATPNTYNEGTEFIFIKFKMGTFLRHFPAMNMLDDETDLPQASSNSFWLGSDTWQCPDYDNTETFVKHLACNDLLIRDKVVDCVLNEDKPHVAERTVRHHFLKSTGLNWSTIRQIERARHAKTLLLNGMSILDVVYQAGYYDQPHLTRSLKQYTGYTPTQILHSSHVE